MTERFRPLGLALIGVLLASACNPDQITAHVNSKVTPSATPPPPTETATPTETSTPTETVIPTKTVTPTETATPKDKFTFTMCVDGLNAPYKPNGKCDETPDGVISGGDYILNGLDVTVELFDAYSNEIGQYDGLTDDNGRVIIETTGSIVEMGVDPVPPEHKINIPYEDGTPEIFCPGPSSITIDKTTTGKSINFDQFFVPCDTQPQGFS